MWLALCIVLASCHGPCFGSFAMRPVAPRHVEDDATSALGSEILQVDEALGVLERRDAEEFNKQKETFAQERTEKSDFRRAFGKKRRELLELAKSQAKGRKPAARSQNTKARKMPCSITHERAKEFAPPGASVWRGLTRGEFCGHLPPYRRVSCSWARYGQEGSLRETLRLLWRQWLAAQGLGEADCPVQGMF